MSSLAVGRGLEDLELWLLAGLFSEAELAAADLLLQLSAAGAGRDDEAAESESSATTYSSRRSASPCLEDQKEEVEEERVIEEKALRPGSMELDRRARKRYRLLSELYATSSPVTSAFTSAYATGAKKKKKKQKRRNRCEGGGFGSPSSSEETRYGGHH